MGLLYENDRRSKDEPKPLVPDRAAALEAISKRKHLEWVARVGGLQVAEAQEFIAQVQAVHAALLTEIQENRVTTKTAAEEFVTHMTGLDFPVKKFMDILAANAGDAGKSATWSELLSVAKSEAL